jgi:hypothetical protein
MIFVLNAFLHVTLLFIFLYILYVFIINKISSDAFKSEIDHIIDNSIKPNIPLIDLQKYKNDYNYKISLLNNLNNNFGLSVDANVLLQENDIDISAISKIIDSISRHNLLDSYMQEYSNPHYVTSLNNKSLLDNGLYVIIIFSIMTILMIATVKISCGLCTNVTKLIIENILTFIFVGAIEYWFFMTYASKFIPAPPSLLTSTAIDSIKTLLVT